ncbi:MAG: LacI family DNA-binding transcriptional regulator [Rhodothermales bacterium]|nr:LacI family DNA-binding transcriptional regulator [Rhodothermales bacterium]
MVRRTSSGRRTIKDVAAEAGVSISTASLALNDKDYVSPDTRARVLSAAKRLGYVPRPAARQLARNQTGNIGFVLRADHFRRSEPFYTHVFLGTEFEADRKDLYVLLATIPPEFDPVEHTPRFLRERNVDGVLVAGKVDPGFVAELRNAGLPVVLIDFEMDELPAVVVDNQTGARTAVEHLIELGHRQIGFVGADMEHPGLRSRLDGYRLALSAAGLHEIPEFVVADENGNPDGETGKMMGERLLTANSPPTAIFCANDALALGVMDTALKQGLAVPHDLSVVGFDDVAGARSAAPSLTTVRVFKEQLGELAIRYLFELMEGTPDESDRYRRGAHDITVPTELVIRNSTGTPLRAQT